MGDSKFLHLQQTQVLRNAFYALGKVNNSWRVTKEAVTLIASNFKQHRIIDTKPSCFENISMNEQQ